MNYDVSPNNSKTNINPSVRTSISLRADSALRIPGLILGSITNLLLPTGSEDGEVLLFGSI